jgi:hypothetical protein
MPSPASAVQLPPVMASAGVGLQSKPRRRHKARPGFARAKWGPRRCQAPRKNRGSHLSVNVC